MQHSVVVVGDINADVALATPSYPPEGGECTATTLRWGSGGAGVNVATALALLGSPARLVGRRGHDPAGDQALAAARAAGVDLALVQVDHERPTGIVFVAVSPAGERTFFSFRGANAALSISADAALAGGCAAAYLSAYTLLESPQQDAALAIADAARTAGIPLMLDLALPPIKAAGPLIWKLLPRLAAVFLNESELALLLPMLGEEQALEVLLTSGVPLVALKKGAAGCLIASTHGRIALQAPPTEACDATGCGDAFAAAFLWGLLRSAPLPACAALGNTFGSLAASRLGSADALPTRKAAATTARSTPDAAYQAAATLLEGDEA